MPLLKLFFSILIISYGFYESKKTKILNIIENLVVDNSTCVMCYVYVSNNSNIYNMTIYFVKDNLLILLCPNVLRFSTYYCYVVKYILF